MRKIIFLVAVVVVEEGNHTTIFAFTNFSIS